jgi:hypothetical protein
MLIHKYKNSEFYIKFIKSQLKIIKESHQSCLLFLSQTRLKAIKKLEIFAFKKSSPLSILIQD